MIFKDSTLANRRSWRRLERRALRGHQHDLQRHLHELSDQRAVVLYTDGSWMSGVVAFQLSGHRLVLGGVTPSTVWKVLLMALSSTRLELRKAGRYGAFWWIAIGGRAEEVGQVTEQVVLATHLQLIHDRGRAPAAELDLPVLSGAS